MGWNAIVVAGRRICLPDGSRGAPAYLHGRVGCEPCSVPGIRNGQTCLRRVEADVLGAPWQRGGDASGPHASGVPILRNTNHATGAHAANEASPGRTGALVGVVLALSRAGMLCPRRVQPADAPRHGAEPNRQFEFRLLPLPPILKQALGGFPARICGFPPRPATAAGTGGTSSRTGRWSREAARWLPNNQRRRRP